MRNLIVLQLNDKGLLECNEISEKGIDWIENSEEGTGEWKPTEIITLDQVLTLLEKDV